MRFIKIHLNKVNAVRTVFLQVSHRLPDAWI